MQEHTLSPLARFERILLAVDGSRYSDGAIRIASAMATKCKADLVVMSVALVDPQYSSLLPDIEGKATRTAHNNVHTAMHAMMDTPCTPLVRMGDDPAQTIVDTAEEIRADLIVMGRHGRRGLARWKLGHATGKVIGHAPCPVLVAPSAADMWQSRVLVATDGSRHGERAAVVAGKLASLCNLPMTAVSAVLPGHSEERRRSAQAAIDEVTLEMGKTGVSINGHLVDGRPDQAILDAARHDHADLIVLGSHGRTGLDKMLMGSVSEKVLNQSDCAVLVVR